MTDAISNIPSDASAYIGVFDSGIGGLSVANAVAGLLPRESLLYVADNAHAPYGPQAPEAIRAYSREATCLLLARGAKLIVVACNTATSLAIDALREEFPGVPFVGLEPAVKPAKEGKTVGVLATQATLNSPRYLALKEKYLGDRQILEDACRGLVPIIEAEATGSPVLQTKLKGILMPMLRAGIDTLVLGCTHYPMVKEDIAAICGPQVNIIDPSGAAARQVVRMLDEFRLAVPQEGGRHNPPAANQKDGLPLPHLALNPLQRTSGPGPNELTERTLIAPVKPTHNFYCTGSSFPLQRALFTLPTLNKYRRLVMPNLVY